MSSITLAATPCPKKAIAALRCQPIANVANILRSSSVPSFRKQGSEHRSIHIKVEMSKSFTTKPRLLLTSEFAISVAGDKPTRFNTNKFIPATNCGTFRNLDPLNPLDSYHLPNIKWYHIRLRGAHFQTHIMNIMERRVNDIIYIYIYIFIYFTGHFT